MTRTWNLASVSGLIAALVLLLAACSAGGGIQIEQRAQAFLGGALSNFGGPDGNDATARSIARDIAIGREFVFVQAGFTVASGQATANIGGADPSFGSGNGQVTVSGNQGTLELTIYSSSGPAGDADLTGTFGTAAAQATVQDPGASFTISWAFEFSQGGTDYSITADQILSGTDWVEI